MPLNNSQPLVVCWGVGQDSTGMLVGMKQKGIRPDIILFANVGSERPETYAFKPVFDNWLESVGFPRSVTVRYQPQNYKHWPPYYTLLENCLTNVTLPSLAYGYHTCSAKWKIAPINKYLQELEWAQNTWRQGVKILKAIGFDDSPHERKRAEKGCQTFAIQTDERDKYELWFPLQQWGWTRDDCVSAIRGEGLPVPPKSSCYFCPAMKPHEVETLGPGELRNIVILEARTTQRHLDHAEKKGWPRGEGIPLVEGLWRREVKGRRGATPHPGSITEYIRQKGLLPSDEIDRIIARTSTRPLTKSELADWPTFIKQILQTPLPQIPLSKPLDNFFTLAPARAQTQIPAAVRS